MNGLKKLIASLLFAMASTSAFAITNAQVFAYVAANYSSLFPGTATAGQYQQYDYRYYAATGNYLAIDNGGTIFVLGPVSGGAITSVGTVASFANTITDWEGKQGGTGNTTNTQVTSLMGGAIQGTPLNLTTAVTTLAGYVSAIPVTITDGTGTAASFYSPPGITTDGTNLYVADVTAIRKIVIATGAVTTLAGSTLGATGSADGTGTAARFANVRGITTDGKNVYVADTDNSTIRKIVIATGAVTTLAGTAKSNGITDGTGAAARFYRPSSLTADGTNLYVADTGNHTIRKIVIATGAVTTLAGTASPFFGYGSTDGTGTAAKFNGPAGITTDGTNLYVADTGNNAIRKVVIATGAVTTLAGGAWGSTDGTGTAALFYSPAGIVTDGTNLYVADSLNTTIRKIVIATGAVTTLASTGWGTAGWGSASVDGKGAAARFARPQGITTDGTSLYVSDIVSTTIRRIQ
ncbi:MAG: NHL repeat-containing protein [Burkholderiales bacterium]